MFLVVALGNPDSKYALTRHNAGFVVMEELVKMYNLKFKNMPKFQAYVAEKNTDDEKVIFAMPLTYMNNSGLAVSRLAKFYKINSENIIVIHDELDLPLGKIRISFDASSGGHNGVESIIHELGTKNFVRVRTGIANELSKSREIPSEKFVLQKFSPAEQKIFTSNLPKYTETIDMILKEGYEKAMAQFN
ncbi:MAG: aminoacyl-tRNA hydrolase [bacterium]